MKNINSVSGEYLVNVNAEKANIRIDVYTRWNSMTPEQRTGWYETNQEHLTFSREDAREGLNRMIRRLVVDKEGYEGMGDDVIKIVSEEHVDRLMDILDDITRGPAFLVFEEFGDMIDPSIDVINDEQPNPVL